MPISSLKPLSARDFDYWKAYHLLNRAGFGGTPSQVRALTNMGLDDAVAHIVDYRSVAVPAVEATDFDADIMRTATPEERRQRRDARRNGDEAVLERLRRERQRRQRADRAQMRAIQEWWLERLIETPRPLEEKMTLFWHGHFATGYRTIEDSYHMFLQNQLFRRHATGNFRELTHGIVRDPAMLRYLNNNQNRRQQPNENLARELMELFTLGEGHGYSEQDIKEGARALTGYTYNDDAFVFRQRMHDDGEKRILGRAGRWDGDDLVDIIFTRDFVSEFICLKLYRFFVNDLPGPPDAATRAYLDKLARRFRAGRYELKPILSTIFRSAHFYDEANVASQIKSPVQLIVQTVRSLRTPVRSLGGLAGAADLMGQDLFYPPSVKGWDGGRAWINTATLFVRQNLLIYLLTGRRPEDYAWESDGAPYDATHLVEHLAEPRAEPRAEPGAEPGAEPPTGPGSGTGGGKGSIANVDPREAAAYLLRFCLGTEPHPERVAVLETFVERAGGRLDNAVLIGMLSLIAAMPEFQLC